MYYSSPSSQGRPKLATCEIHRNHCVSIIAFEDRMGEVYCEVPGEARILLLSRTKAYAAGEAAQAQTQCKKRVVCTTLRAPVYRAPSAITSSKQPQGRSCMRCEGVSQASDTQLSSPRNHSLTIRTGANPLDLWGRELVLAYHK